MGRLYGRIVSVTLSAVCAAAAFPASAEDPLTRLQLMGAAFVRPAAAAPPGHTLASAFLPGRGIITWDVTGMTAEQAQEAEIEAMGLADARAVQQELDAKARVASEPARGGPQAAAPLTSGTALAEARDAPAPRIRPDARTKGGLNAESLGVRSGESLKSRPRLYAFAAASGTGMGLNVLHDDGGWRNAGLTTDRGGFSGQKQAGLAWRLGRAQTALSYVQEKTRGEIPGMPADHDHRVMLTTTLSTASLVSLFDRRD